MNDKSTRQFNNRWLVLFGILAIVGIVMFMLTKNNLKQKAYRLDVKSGEVVSLANFRLLTAEAQLERKASTVSKCEFIRGIVKKFDPRADWFSSCTGTLRLNSLDTESKKVNTISSDTHCATLTFDKDLHYLIDYSFKNEICKGYPVDFK